jgi:hypothetical protein
MQGQTFSLSARFWLADGSGYRHRLYDQGNSRFGQVESGRRTWRGSEWRSLSLSDDRLIQFLQYLAILLFVGGGVLPLARSRHPWAKWARWGSIAILSLAVLYAVALTIRWALGVR